jgi:hypothetical protein
MSKFVPPRKVRQFLGLAAFIAVAAFLLEGCKQDTPVAASAPAPLAASAPAPAAQVERTKEQAMAALMALPELKAWSDRLDKDSQGKIRGALIEYDQTPKLIDGKSYWQFSFVENGSAAAHRWESFLVAQKGEEILIDDDSTGKTLTLEQWRQERHPMQRTSADVIGG